MDKREMDGKEMNYITEKSSSHSYFTTGCGEKMESAPGNGLFRESAVGRDTSLADGEKYCNSVNACRFIAEETTYMADYEFSDSGEVTAVRYTAVKTARAVRFCSLQ